MFYKSLKLKEKDPKTIGVSKKNPIPPGIITTIIDIGIG